MITVRDRYLQDPVFHVLVDMIRSGIRDAKYTPGEVREAAVLAAYLEEMENPQPRWFHLVEQEMRKVERDGANNPSVMAFDPGTGDRSSHRCTGCEWFINSTNMSEDEVTAAVHDHLRKDHGA